MLCGRYNYIPSIKARKWRFEYVKLSFTTSLILCYKAEFAYENKPGNKTNFVVIVLGVAVHARSSLRHN